MNDKLCKRLRMIAHRASLQQHLKDHQPIVMRQLMVDPRHEGVVRANGGRMDHVTAVNNPKSTRGIYRALKREVRAQRRAGHSVFGPE